MNSEIEQLLIDKCGQFKDEFGDVIIWFNYYKSVNGWRILMLDRKNRSRTVERLISNTQIECANFDILWFEFENMRRGLLG